jgi:hypothetical protein
MEHVKFCGSLFEAALSGFKAFFLFFEGEFIKAKKTAMDDIS